MQKTQLTVLIEKMDKGIASMQNETTSIIGLHVNKAMIAALNVFRDEAIALLPKERDDMEKMFQEGLEFYDIETSDENFNKNFTQYKP